MSKVLVFGGTRFFGKELIKELLINGHDITIATRGIREDSFGSRVKRIRVDKRDEKALEDALIDKQYDVIYDTICYSSKDAERMCKVLKEKTKKYIVVSSVSVYDKGYSLRETAFNPNKYKIIMGEREEFSYSEGKRLMEATLYKNATFQVVAVRFPVVIGKDDYTERLLTYVERVKNGQVIFSTKLDENMNLITQNEAGVFLAWLLNKDINAPVNASCIGEISLRDIVKIIEKEYDKEAVLKEKEDDDKTSPYNNYLGLTIDIMNIMELGGYRFKDITSELKEVIKSYK
ncbi:MAG: NAD-dependent epimerase/dehydratase family protein [Clostridium sp.]|uniref:NAD-dependent epimerase/dehydratase family protein n=1 Tax=Clostridium sp. TaxID=1506 RepID=UPI003F2E6ADB